MPVREFEFKMKDGRTAVIRSPREEDAAGLLDYLYVTACETEFLMRYPEECGKYTLEGERAFIEKANTSDSEAAALCVVDGVIVGLANIMWSRAIKTKHRASVGIAVVREFWGLGIGAALMEELIRIARENEDLIQIELDCAGTIRVVSRDVESRVKIAARYVEPDGPMAVPAAVQRTLLGGSGS